MNVKLMMGIGLIVGIVAITLLAAPIQAYVSGNDNENKLQTQAQDKLKTQDCDCDMLQMQEHHKLRTQNHDCNGVCTETQYRYRQRINECATNNFCNCTKNMEQYRHQNTERTTSLGD